MSTVISVENISKAYRLGTIGGADLKDDFARWWAKIRGRPDPLSKIGEEHHSRLMGEEFWALDDVSFQVKEGEVLGIIGRNGAGKSTLLKILSQVTAPTSGEVKIKGRIASLLEVGTGFHPDLTGRENVVLNGSILGMTRGEIRRKFDEIVAFSEIEEFIDTPVKRYSSGMYVRLAFAVAAHLEPEILIVDEVLAVGDAQFQQKCVGKMGQASRDGRTVLFVSHNLAVVSSLCNRALLLEGGRKTSEGLAADVVSAYVQSDATTKGEVTWDGEPNANNGRLRLGRARTLSNGQVTANVTIDQAVVVQYEFEVLLPELDVCTSIHLYDKYGTCVLASGTPSRVLEGGWYRHSCVFPANFLNDGRYTISILLISDITRFDVSLPEALSFVVHEVKGREGWLGEVIGSIRPHLQWEETALEPAAANL